MSEIEVSVIDFNSQSIRIERRGDRIWVNLTDMAKASGIKTILAWRMSKRGKEYIRGICKLEGVELCDLYVSERKGTWAEIAIALAIISDIRPCSVSFTLRDAIYKVFGLTAQKAHEHIVSGIEQQGGFPVLLEKLTKAVEKGDCKNFVWEYEYSDYLANLLNGLREVNVPCGRIDVLTETEIIEVKEKPRWMEAAEQVNRYHIYYPTKNKKIFLFGRSAIYSDELIETVCGLLGIEVEFASLSRF